MKDLFSKAELEEIKRAVSGAEERTSGEIVPYIVERSDRYDVTLWRGASLFAILVICLVGLTYQFYDGWGLAWVYSGQGIAFLVLVAGLIGALLGAYVAPLKRFLAGQALLARTVHHRAMRAFVEEEVFNTRDRTGILLFISMLEHRIEVLGDEGINRRVTADDWTEVVAKIRSGIKQKKVAQGLIDAIDICGKLLERRGVEIQPDDSDELSNEVRFSDDD
ncbi:MAG: TPM domain-containing protein [Rhodothermales bacterium]